MTVLSFRSRYPSTQDIVEAVYSLTEAFPAWAFELDQGEDDGRPTVSAEHRMTDMILSAHWGGDHWAVVTEGGKLVSRSRELPEAFRNALA